MMSQELRETVTALPTYGDYAAAFGELAVRREEAAGQALETRAGRAAEVRLCEAEQALVVPQAEHAAELVTASSLELPQLLGILTVVEKPVFARVDAGAAVFNGDVSAASYATPSQDPFERAADIGRTIAVTAKALPPGKQIAIAHLTPGRSGKGSARPTDARYYVTTKEAFVLEDPTVRERRRSHPLVEFRLPEIACKEARYLPGKDTIGGQGLRRSPARLAVPQLEQLASPELQIPAVLRVGKEAVQFARQQHEATVGADDRHVRQTRPRRGRAARTTGVGDRAVAAKRRHARLPSAEALAQQ